MRIGTLHVAMVWSVAAIVLGPVASVTGQSKKEERLRFQYLAGTIRIPAAREDEPTRTTVSFEKALRKTRPYNSPIRSVAF